MKDLMYKILEFEDFTNKKSYLVTKIIFKIATKMNQDEPKVISMQSRCRRLLHEIKCDKIRKKIKKEKKKKEKWYKKNIERNTKEIWKMLEHSEH